MKLAVIGHAHINPGNRNDFLRIPGMESVKFLCPVKWKGSFSEQYINENGFPLLHIPKTRNAYIPFLRDLHDIDILWVDEEPYLPQTYCILKKYRHIPVRIVRTAQNIGKKNALFHYLYNYTYRESTEIVAVSNSSAFLVNDMTGKSETSVIPLSIDDEFFITGENRHFNMNNKLKLGFAARLDKSKGTDMLIDIVKSLEFPCKLILAGAGPEESYMKKALDSINVDYEFRGFIEHGHMAGFYSDIDVFLNLSQTTRTWSEQLGRAVIEASASGCLVISSDSGELKYIMENIGKTFSERDTDGLIEYLTYINDNRGILKMDVSSYSVNAKHFNKSNIGRSIGRLLEKYGNHST